MAQRGWKRVSLLWAISCAALCFALLVACQNTKRIVLRADGQERIIQTTAATVRDLLQELGITLGDYDRVEPSLWVELPRSATVTVIRSRIESLHQPIPFTRQVVKDEALPEGKIQLLQSGRPGVLELKYRVSYDGERELDRQLFSQKVIEEQRAEIVAVGTRGSPAGLPVTGTIAYLGNGNAWVIRRHSGEKRPVTFSGDLDGHVFDLNKDGRNLLFTRSTTLTASAGNPPFNELYVADTRILQEEPRSLGITNVLYASWSPDGHWFVYSTAEQVNNRDGTPEGTAAGWRPRNDLWLSSADGATRAQIISTRPEGSYRWWGIRCAWHPREPVLAYMAPDALGLIEPITGRHIVLLRFPPLEPCGEWLWLPPPSWSPEGRYLAYILRDPSAVADDNPFGLWVLDLETGLNARLASGVGLGSNPTWSAPWRDIHGESHVEIAYGVPHLGRPEIDLYDLYIMDRDGSNKTRVFPPQGKVGLENVEIAWSPAERKLACIWRGDLYVLDLEQEEITPLTSGVICEKVEWEGSVR